MGMFLRKYDNDWVKMDEVLVDGGKREYVVRSSRQLHKHPSFNPYRLNALPDAQATQHLILIGSMLFLMHKQPIV